LSFLGNLGGSNRLHQLVEEKNNLLQMIDQEKSKGKMLEGMLLEIQQKNAKNKGSQTESQQMMKEIATLEREIAYLEQNGSPGSAKGNNEAEKEAREYSLKIAEMQKQIIQAREEYARAQKEKNIQASNVIKPVPINPVSNPLGFDSSLSPASSFQGNLSGPDFLARESDPVKSFEQFLRTKNIVDPVKHTSTLFSKGSYVLDSAVLSGSLKTSSSLSIGMSIPGPMVRDGSGSDFLAKFNSELSMALQDPSTFNFNPPLGLSIAQSHLSSIRKVFP
jgi:hypothetical protein